MTAFHVIHNDGLVMVTIDESGHAVLTVELLNDIDVLVRAINRAVERGAKTATLFTGEVVNERQARKFAVRAEQGTKWRGANVLRLADTEDGPCFRLDWDDLSPVTE
jgi:hypothetical protein